MSREVDRILTARSRREGHRPEAASFGAALLLHALVAATVLLLPRLQPPPPPLEFVPVQIIPAQALGVRRPAPPRRRKPEPVAEEQKAAEPEPPAPEPEKPEVKPPEPAREEAPVLPDETEKKPPKKPEPPQPENPRTGKAETGTKPEAGKPGSEGTAGVAPGETGDQLGRRGAATGNPLGTSVFGNRIGVDNPDFTYGYYLDRLLSLIDANWQRPSMGSGVRTVLFFRIERDGTVAELRVAESSGYNSFDLAALRAVQNAAPFPPLPRAYRNDSLGVNLIVY